MPAIVTFTTPPFTVTFASAIDASTIRVTFTAPPNAFFPANFSIPTTVVVAAVPDPSDPNSVILSLLPALLPNNYTVTCLGLTSGAPPVPISAPFTALFTVFAGPSVPVTPGVSAAAQNPTATSFIRAAIPPSMKGNVWTQLLASIGDEEQFAWDQSASVYDQLFLISAEGKYLDARASEEGGYKRPEQVGFSDDVFRDLVIQLSTRKLTLNAFLRILEIYYGLDSVRAFVRTTVPEPFNIPDGSEQSFLIDGIGPFTVLFHAEDFTSSTSASAIETAIALNRGFNTVGAKALALPFVDNQTGLTYLTVYTASRGLRGSVESTSVTGPLSFPGGKHTVQTQSHSAYVRALGNTVEVVMPATSLVVTRTPDSDSADIQGVTPISIVSAAVLGNTMAVTTSINHGMLAGDQVIVDSLLMPPGIGIPFAVNGVFRVDFVPGPNSFTVILG